MKKISKIIMAVIVAGLVPGMLFAAELLPAAVSGKVVLIKTGTNQVLVAYKRQGAFLETISTFKIDEKTELKNFGALSELKLNDTVSVIYLESETGNLMAQKIEKFKQEGGTV